MKVTNKTILIVDNETEIVRLLSTLVEIADPNLKILTALNGMDALQVLEQSSYDIDLIMSDNSMPKLSGVMLRKQLMYLGYDNIPFVLITADQIENNFNFNKIIEKPFTNDEIISLISNIANK